MNFKGSDNEKILAGMIEVHHPSVREALYRAYAGYLTGVCTRYISDPTTAKDVLHESFLKIFDSIESFEYRGPGSIKGWLTRIVVNQSLKTLNSQKLTFPLEGETESLADDVEEPSVSDISPEVLHNLIRILPDGYRTVLNLYVFENKSHKEIARLLNIKEASSASQYHRAKSMLARAIREYLHSLR